MYDSNNFGLSDDYEYHEICIDSMDSTQAFNPAYTNLNWPKITLGKELENVAAIKVLQVIVPKTWYNINTTNQTFNFYSFWNIDTPVNFWRNRGPLTIAAGQYTKSSLITEMSSILTTALSSIPLTATLSDLASRMKMFYTISGSVGADRKYLLGMSEVEGTAQSSSTILKNNARTTPRRVLGWEGGMGTATSTSITVGTGLPASITTLYYSPQVWGVTGSAKTTTSTFVDELNPPTIYLNSRTLGTMVNLFLNGNGIMIPPNTGAIGPQLCSIPVGNTLSGENIIYSDPDPQKYFKFGGNLKFPSSFDLYLTSGTSSEQIPLDLNGGRFCVKLGVLTNKKTIDRSFPSSTGGYSRVTKLVLTK